MKSNYFERNPIQFELNEEMLDCDSYVVIPAYKEFEINKTLESLKNAFAADFNIGILIVLNHRLTDSLEVKSISKKCNAHIKVFKELHPNILIQELFIEFEDEKKSGVGIARKLGMDLAAHQLVQKAKYENLIFCLDADSTVSLNYFKSVLEAFNKQANKSAASIFFEHPLKGTDYSHEVYEAIALYELHLRYFIQAQRSIGIPHAYHTIGSAMVVRAHAYIKEGGMNKRKAGEDFYFLHKFISKNVLFEIHDACVYPSPRRSDRVPFGTGKAVGNILFEQKLMSYNLQSFMDLQFLFENLNSLYKGEKLKLSEALMHWIHDTDFYLKINEIKNNTSNFESFRKRFWQYFNGFMLMKCLHFLRDHYYPNEDIILLSSNFLQTKKRHSIELLKKYRDLQSIKY